MDTVQLDDRHVAEVEAKAARDYFEGWYDADRAHARALHPELAKRTREADGSVRSTTRWSHDRAHRRGRGPRDGGDRTLEISGGSRPRRDRDGDRALAVYREYLHLVRTDEGWRIVNALWAFRSTGRRT